MLPPQDYLKQPVVPRLALASVELASVALASVALASVALASVGLASVALASDALATEASVWRYVAPKLVSAEDEETEKRNRGAQIDLVIKRADRITHLCEMKFSQIPYSIAASYTDKLLERESSFMNQTGTQHGVVMTFVTPYGLATSMNSGLIHSVITAKDLMKE